MIKRLLLTSILALPGLCYGQINFTFTDGKSGLQINDDTFQYQGGVLNLGHQDGSWTLAGCAQHPSPVPVFPNMFCPLGTTGFILRGDLDGDDVPDDGSYWSLTAAPINTVLTDPFSDQGIRTESAPYSDFMRPDLIPVQNGSVEIQYNALDFLNQYNYNIALYSYQQEFLPGFQGRKSNDKTVKAGPYRFSIPLLNGAPNQRQVFGFDKPTMPESYPGFYGSVLDSGFRFSNDDLWDGQGRLEFDPRLFDNYLTYEGIIPGVNFFPNFDELRLWVLADPSLNPFANPPTDATDPNLLYPAGAGAVLLRYPDNVSSLRLPNWVFNPGDEGTLYLRMDRGYRESIVTDASIRVWMVRIRFVDSYAGWALLNAAFPAGTTDEERAPYYDYDGDGASNLLEFALQTDPVNPASNPTAAGAVVPFINEAGQCEVTVAKRPDVGTTLKYYIEYSSDMVTWTRIPDAGDANWTIVIDNEDEITAQSIGELPAGSCYVRVAVVTK